MAIMMAIVKRKLNSPGELIATALALFAAGISPLIFSISAAGYGSLQLFALWGLLPSMFLLIVLEIVAWQKGWKRLQSSILNGVWIGFVSTIGLEIVRETGFRVFHAMPGDLPMLMGVLLTNRFMLGPNFLSNLLGWSYHFWNGAAFAMIYILIFGRLAWWSGLIYGVFIGIGFMLSPVVNSLGVGYFGSQFGIGFPITVTLAHLVFGVLLGWLVELKQMS